jgi:F1F0 ATPase subunit 2
MSSGIAIAIGFVGGGLGGLALGAAFFGGLWLTVRRLTSGRGSVVLPALSLLVRLALLGVGLWLAARLGAAALLGCAVGLTSARALALRLARVGSLYPADERTSA